VRCARCGRGNAADAKFCAGCGVVLTGAADAAAEALDAPLSAEVFKPLPARDPQFAFRVAVASGVLVVVLGAAAYYLYKNFFFADFSLAYKRSVPAAEVRKDGAPGPASTGAEPAATGVIKPVPVPQGEAPAMAPESVAPARIEAPPSAPPRSAPPRSAPPRSAPPPSAPPRSASARSTELQSAPSESRAPRKPAPARIAVKPAAIGAASCTDALAAVGLCVSASPQAPRTTGDAVSKPAAAQSGAGSCQDGISALGLCTPASNQRKE